MGEKTPTTLANELMILIEDTLSLDVADDVHKTEQKGLYDTLKEHLVVIWDGPEVIAVATAGELRHQILPRSWHGSLGEWIHQLPLPPEVTAQTRVADLGLLVQQVRHARWLVTIDDETCQPIGLLSRGRVLDFLPPLDDALEVYRSANLRLWGDPQVKHHYYYCAVEKRYYGPNRVLPDSQGMMRDWRGHLVEKIVPPDQD